MLCYNFYMNKLRTYAQSVPLTFESWILSFVGIVLIRIFFEQFSGFSLGRFLVIEMPSIIHFNIFFLTCLVGLMVILILFAKIGLKEAATITLFGLSVLWVAPLVDLAVGGVGGHIMTYIFAHGKELFLQYITYFSSGQIDYGVTLGMRIEGILAAFFCYVYVYAVTKNILRSIGAIFILYTFIFLLGSSPSLITLFFTQQNEVLVSIVQSIISSHIITNNIHPSFSATNIGIIELAFNKIMLGTNIIVLALLTISLFFITARKKLVAIIKNCRPERLFFFFILSIFGVVLAGGTWSNNWIDIQSYILAIIALICAGIFSICQNDLYDEEIDAISNANRPLISKDLSKDDMKMASKIFFIFALLSAYAVSHYVLFFTCFGIFIFFIYSNPPLRLKRFAILNSFLVGLSWLVALMAGFFFASLNKAIIAFPFSLVLAFLISFSVISNLKDIKDIEGDKAGGIKTIPVLLGAKKSKMLIAAASCFFVLVAPWYFKISFIFILSIITSIALWYFMNKENYKEMPVFIVFVAYLILIIGAIVLK